MSNRKRERKRTHKRAIRGWAMRKAIAKGVREGRIKREWNPILGDWELSKVPKRPPEEEEPSPN